MEHDPPISRTDLRDLFLRLDASAMGGAECDHTYLDGEVEIRIDGEPSIIGTPGKVGHVPFKKMHTAITGDKGARLVVFRIHSKGAPVRYLERGGSAERWAVA